MANQPDRTLGRVDEDPSPEQLVTEVLLNRRRRHVLYYVAERSGPVSLEDLALQVAAWERSTTPEEVTAAHAESVSASLRRDHLSYLEARDFVTYDSHTDRVVGHLDDPTVEFYVANDPRTMIAWHKVYLVLTVVSTVLLGLTQVGVPPFRELRPLTTAALIVALYAVASVVYWYDVYRWRRRNENKPPDFLLSVDEELPDGELECGPDEGDETK
jgi:hypothetical protein